MESRWAISNPKRGCCESATLSMPANLENSAVATGLEKVSFHSNPEERQSQRKLKLPHGCPHLTCWQSNAQNSPNQAVNCELPDVQAGIRRGRGTREQTADICWIIEKAREIQKKHLLLLYWLHQSLWLCGSQQTEENSERDGIPDHLTCLLKSLYAGQEATARTGHGTTDVPNWERSMSRLYIFTLLI